MSDNGRRFRMILRIQVKPGTEREFEQTWLGIADDVSNQPGNIEQWLMKSADEPSVFHVISDWVDEATFREFSRSDHHLEHRSRLAPYRQDGAISTMRVLHHLEAK